ncbi:MAG: phage integrase SAM-like domain-containing protein [Bacteroidota bacterium]
MLFPLKKICDKKRIRRDGNSTVFIQYCFTSERRTLLNTSVNIPPKYWDAGKQMVRSTLPPEHGSFNELNFELRRMYRLVEDLIATANKREVKDPLEFVKELFTPSLSTEKIPELLKKIDARNENVNMDIYFQMESYAEYKMKKVAPDVRDVYRNTMQRLRAFEEYRKKPITFECLDYNFYEEFVDFLLYEYVQRRNKGKKGLRLNTVGTTIKQFRIFLKNRAMKKIIEPINMDGWTVHEEAADAVYVNWKEILDIYHLDLSQTKFLEEYRDDFVLGCLTGLRFSDFSKLQPNDIRGEFLYKKQQKSNHWVVIPLRPEAKEILQRRFKKGKKPQTNPEFNRHIKTIAMFAEINQPITHSYKRGNQEMAETKPKYEWITSHTCRRSFCTNEFLAGTPVELIMKISGHKTTKDFYKYIKVSPEEAANKIKELWDIRANQVVGKSIKAFV